MQAYHDLVIAIFNTGNYRWVNSMEWTGQQQYATAPDVPFMVNGTEAGLLKSYGPVSFLKVCLLLIHLLKNFWGCSFCTK